MDQTIRRDEINADHVRRAYATWAPVYDLIFSNLLTPGRRAGASRAERKGGLVLNVGVGTGLELPMFDPRTAIIGIDLSEAMLQRAQRRVKREKLTNVRGLVTMDAQRLAFPDDSFDAAFAPYVLTVVPNPVATLDELARVVKPGGEIVLVNHIGAETGIAAHFEAWLGKNSARIGWRPNFAWSIIADWLAGREDFQLLERQTLPPFALFTLLRLRKKL